MNQYPFVDFASQRKNSYDVPRVRPVKLALTTEDEIKTPYKIETSGEMKFKEQAQSLTAKASRNQSKKDKVTFWAGLRIEGALTPFERRDDEHSKWHVGIANGQLFEKIGGPPYHKWAEIKLMNWRQRCIETSKWFI